MRRMYIKNKRIFYVSGAIICLLILFVGINIIVNIKEDNKNEVIKVVEVFSDESDNAIKNNEDLENIQNDNSKKEIDSNIFTLLLSNSNAFTKSVYMSKYKARDTIEEIKNTFIKSLHFNNKLLKSQFPAVINIINVNKTLASNEYSSIENKKDDHGGSQKLKTFENLEVENDLEPLEDIAFVETEKEVFVSNGDIIENKERAIEVLKQVNKSEKMVVNKEKPYVLIYHTHATEAYLPIKDSNFRSTDKNYNVLAIGNIIEKNLTAMGHKVIHVENFHDLPSYSQSYKRSLSTIKENIKKENNLKVLIDIHRDGVAEDASYYDKALKESLVKIDGKEMATFKFVIGKDTPNRTQVLEFANYVKGISDIIYPGLCLDNINKPYGKFNQYMSDHSLLIEVGSNLNTIEQSKETAKKISEILDIALTGLIN